MTGTPYELQFGCSNQASRVREERIRLGFDDSTAGEKEFCRIYAGITQGRLRAIETESNLKPLKNGISIDEMRFFAAAGMDVNYIVAGVRSMALNREEQALLDNYRACSDADKAHLKAVGNAFAQSDVGDELDVDAG